MDKLRAIEVFVAAAEAKSFSAAARRLEVSIPAVARWSMRWNAQWTCASLCATHRAFAHGRWRKILEARHRVLEQVAAADESIGEPSSVPNTRWRPCRNWRSTARARLACISPAIPGHPP